MKLVNFKYASSKIALFFVLALPFTASQAKPEQSTNLTSMQLINRTTTLSTHDNNSFNESIYQPFITQFFSPYTKSIVEDPILNIIEVNDKYGFIDKSGHLVIKPKYLGITGFGDGLIGVQIEDDTHLFLCGFINYQGETVIPFEYEAASHFAQGLAPVKKNGKFGFINHQNQVVIPFQFDHANSFSEGALARVKIDEKWGFINTDGKLMTPLYDSASLFYQGLSSVRKNNKTGAINTQGDIIIPFEYDNQYFDFNEQGLAGAKKGDKWGVIDSTGELVIPFQYETIDDVERLLSSE